MDWVDGSRVSCRRGKSLWLVGCFLLASAGAVAQEVLVPFLGDWDYFVGSQPPSSPMNAWKEEGFVPPPAPVPLPSPAVGVWLRGPAPIGYGSGAKGIRTPIASSDAADGNYTTVYFRRQFQVSDASSVLALSLELDFDDGFVAYINGFEVARYNVDPGDEAVFDSLASNGHEFSAMPRVFDASAGLNVLRSGTNLLAIEVKNVSQTSSDIVFDVRLSTSDPPCPPDLECRRSLDGVTLSWTNPIVYDSIVVTRNGAPIAGSPFPGTTETAFDANVVEGANYEVRPISGDFECPPLECKTPTAICIVTEGAIWSFFRGVAEPSPDPVTGAPTTEWTEPAFDDTSWEVGPSGFGYGDGDDATALLDMQDTYTTVYVRTTFRVNPGAVPSLAVAVDYDDGFVAYLNGVEVARSDSMGGPAAAGTVHAFDEVSGGLREAGAREVFVIPLAGAVNGDNTIAIQGFNTNAGSSDFSLIPEVCTGLEPCPDPATVSCVRQFNGVTVSWVNPSGGAYDSIAVLREGVPIAGSPFAGTTESVTDPAAPAGTLEYQVIHRTGLGEDCEALVCTVGPETALLVEGEDWRFFRGTAEPSPDPVTGGATTGWAAVGFNDAGWEVGPSGFGYGDGDDATVLADMEELADDPATPGVDEAQPGYSTVYARKVVTIPDLGEIDTLALSIDHDDAFVAYFNGVEFARSANAGAAGTVQPFDATATGGHEAGTTEFYAVPDNLIQAGDNLLAVQGLNLNLDSSDFSLIPGLLANLCIPVNSLACMADPDAGTVGLSWSRGSHDEYLVFRNGVELAASPFPAGTTAVVDASPDLGDNVYEVIGVQDGKLCPPASCTVDCADLFPDAFTCVLSLDPAGPSTRADLSWTFSPVGTMFVDVRREGAVIGTLAPAARNFADPDVESLGPEEDTEYSVHFLDAEGTELCVLTCGPLSLCPEMFTCTAVDGTVELTWTNVVKAWESYTILRDGVELASGIPGDATSFVDTDVALIPGLPIVYTLQPIAAPGSQAPCDQTATCALQVPELAKYQAPAGGWDYAIEFSSGQDQYNPESLEPGNLDGNWIRAAEDSWDGSAPLEVGDAPDGPAPGGVAIESVAGLGECSENASVLRILDPGDPSAPGGSLATEYPDAYDEPSNERIILGFDTGVLDRNLLRDGVTIAGRWRINPDAPEYLNAGAAGDGTPITAGLGQLGIFFFDDGSLGTQGGPVGLSFALNSGDVMQVNTAPVTQIGAADVTTFRSFWATVEDPEGDETYNVTFYLNGNEAPFTLFATMTDADLQAAAVDFGEGVGNFLVLSLPSTGNDGDIQIDWFGYKAGVHLPLAEECAPCANNPPSATIRALPSDTVALAGGSAQVTLDGTGSGDGDGGVQGLSYLWAKVSGPGGDALATPRGDTTTVTFTAAGVYRYRLTVDDGEACSSGDSALVTITVTGGGGDPVFRRGDGDGSGRIELTDAIFVLNFLFTGGRAPPCPDSADGDDSSRIELTDAIFILNFLFTGGREPPAPGPATCGPDPSADALEACNYPAGC